MDYISVNIEVLYKQFVFNQRHFNLQRIFQEDGYNAPFYYNLDNSHLMKDQIMMQTKMIITINPLHLHRL